MANPEHIAKLLEDVQAWNKWRDENPDIEIDLRDASLSSAHLRGVNLGFALLRRADLRYAHLVGANLEHADLTEAHLEGADLTEAHLEDASLGLAHLEDAYLDPAYLQGAILDFAHLKGANLQYAHLEGANLMNAHLEGTDLRQTHLQGANLDYAHLEDARFEDANLEDAHLWHANLEHANLMNANLKRAVLNEANLKHAILQCANLQDTFLHEAKLHRADMRAAELQNAGLLGLEYFYPLSLKRLGYRRRIMRGHFEGIRGLDSCYGNRIFARDAADQDYLDTLHTQWNGRWGRFWFWVWGLTDYGRSFMSIIVFASILMFAFGAAYSHWPQLTTHAKDIDPNRFMPFYFSIVTYTTLGFGDVRPNSLAGEILVCLEVVFGYVTLGLLLAVLGNKIARRSQ